MSIPHGPLASWLTELVALFNAQKLDLPPGSLHKDCVFRLNGRAYHEHLGRSPSDPLVRLIGCGPGAYRLLVNAVRYAIPGARIRVHPGHTREEHVHGLATLTARATLAGQLRPSGDPYTAECIVILTGTPADGIREFAVTMGDADVEWLVASRIGER